MDSLLSKSFDYSFSSSFINDEEEEIIEPKEPSEIDEPIDEWEPRVPMEPKQDKEPIID